MCYEYIGCGVIIFVLRIIICGLKRTYITKVIDNIKLLLFVKKEEVCHKLKSELAIN